MGQQMAVGRAKQAVVAHLDETVGQHVLEEAANELCRAESAALDLSSGGFFVAESDWAVFEFADTVIAEGHAKDVRGEILEGGDA